MAEYIERDALLAAYDATHKGAAGRARKLMVDAPTADVAPVRHGRWEYHECVSSHDGTISVYACSACRFCIDEEVFEQLDSTNYCPNCGAKVQEVSDG